MSDLVYPKIKVRYERTVDQSGWGFNPDSFTPKQMAQRVFWDFGDSYYDPPKVISVTLDGVVYTAESFR